MLLHVPYVIETLISFEQRQLIDSMRGHSIKVVVSPIILCDPFKYHKKNFASQCSS